MSPVFEPLAVWRAHIRAIADRCPCTFAAGGFTKAEFTTFMGYFGVGGAPCAPDKSSVAPVKTMKGLGELAFVYDPCPVGGYWVARITELTCLIFEMLRWVEFSPACSARPGGSTITPSR